MALSPYTGGNLTVGNELNKLAANIALGRIPRPSGPNFVF
jgi:hypothetical protein